MMTRMRAVAGIALALMLLLGVTACSGDSESDAETPAENEDTDTADAGDAHAEFTVASSAYADDGDMPVAYAREGAGGANVSPPVAWLGTPEGTESFAVVMVDRHPIANEWVHWMVVDVPADAAGLNEGASGTAMPGDSRELSNTFGQIGYGGPEPPAGSGRHEYEITVYALDVATLEIADDADFAGLIEAVRDHMLDAAVVSGFFEQ